jgi:hypothetical protein
MNSKQAVEQDKKCPLTILLNVMMDEVANKVRGENTQSQ